MKMGAGTFWGLFLILVGIALLLKVIFKIDIPVFKIVLASFFILLGIRILFGNFNLHRFKTSGNDALFSEIKVTSENFNYPEYNMIFGKGTFDLRDLDIQKTGTKYVKIDIVFGGVEIVLNQDTPVKITTESVFAGGKLPDGNSTAFGTSTYISPNYDPVKPHLNMRIEMVFGGIDIKRN